MTDLRAAAITEVVKGEKAMEQQREELATKRDLEKVEQRLTGKIDANSKKIDNLTVKVVKNSEQISRMLTKEEYKEHFNEIMRGQDKMMTILTRMDQERVATTAWIGRIEGDVEKNKSEIERIKTKLA